ncbi:MAG TPA: M1 family aminopeptidase, partial [Vicinamibacterales bacterium]|nr:M1 family aminopeptidase [Vicinamibacterales bacterium]
RWAIDQSDQGPVYLGYRLGHIKNDGRIFRALVYNKGAAVLHMLRRLLGDEAFFGGLRRFYASAKFRKVGTDELKEAFEAEAGRSLDRFFEAWIYGSAIPRLKVQYRIDGKQLAVHVDQLGDTFEVPLVLTVEYMDRSKTTLVIPVTDRTLDRRFPLSATIRNVEINRDEGGPAEIVQ